jgi:hypothetical protein
MKEWCSAAMADGRSSQCIEQIVGGLCSWIPGLGSGLGGQESVVFFETDAKKFENWSIAEIVFWGAQRWLVFLLELLQLRDLLDFLIILIEDLRQSRTCFRCSKNVYSSRLFWTVQIER